MTQRIHPFQWNIQTITDFPDDRFARAGNDVNMISYWLGHANINTTPIYVEIDMEMKQRMLQKAKAPAVKKPLPWQKPDVLQWLKALTKGPQLWAVKY